MNRPTTEEPVLAEVVFMTGYPRKLAAELSRRLLARDSETRIRLLVPAAAETEARELAAGYPDRVVVLLGDVSAMDMGLSGSEYQLLTTEVTTIHHIAHAAIRESSREDTERLNVGGTRSVLQLASECKQLRRLCHWSTTTVAGRCKGVVLEEDLDRGQSFHSFHEQTRLEAEKLVRAAMKRLPVTVLRPGIIVGDSRTGQSEEFDGAYSLMSLLVHGNHSIPVPLPSTANAPLHLVPMSYVVAAGEALARDARAAGQTYHLTDCNPFPARRVFELVAEIAHAKVARRSLPTGIARTLLRAPGIEKLSRAPRALLDTVDQQVFFNNRHACAVLDEHGIHCPPFDSYVATLVEDIRNSKTEPAPEAAPDQETIDPFDD